MKIDMASVGNQSFAAGLGALAEDDCSVQTPFSMTGPSRLLNESINQGSGAADGSYSGYGSAAWH